MKQILEKDKYKWNSPPYQRRVLARALRSLGYTTYSDCDHNGDKITPGNYNRQGPDAIKYMQINDKFIYYGKSFYKVSTRDPGIHFALKGLHNFQEQATLPEGWSLSKQKYVSLLDGHLRFEAGFDRYFIAQVKACLNPELFSDDGEKTKVRPRSTTITARSIPPMKLYMRQIIIKKELNDIKNAIEAEYIFQDKLREKQSEAAKAKKPFRHIRSK
jgi:hypothetical protein